MSGINERAGTAFRPAHRAKRVNVTAWFSEVDLRMAAGPTVFGRGRRMVEAVRDVETTAEGVRALVEGTSVYKVFLGPASPGLFGECDCPYSAAGKFCKHCVALGLVVLGSAAP